MQLVWNLPTFLFGNTGAIVESLNMRRERGGKESGELEGKIICTREFSRRVTRLWVLEPGSVDRHLRPALWWGQIAPPVRNLPTCDDQRPSRSLQHAMCDSFVRDISKLKIKSDVS